MEELEWYNFEEDEVIKKLESSHDGLTTNEAEKRLNENGYNRLKEPPKKKIYERIIEQFKNVMIIVLIISAIISGIIGFVTEEGIIDSLIIFFVVIVNAVLGVMQESKADKAIDALKKLSIPYIKVKRDGVIKNIKTEELVVGDIVLVEAGDFVPADMRIIKCASLKVQESALTGESVPIDKQAASINSNEVVLAERINMIYSGSSVTYGRAEGIVVSIGMNTELGKIANELTKEKETMTPLQKKMDEISKMLSIIILVIASVMFLFGIGTGQKMLEMFMLSVSLAVAAIPEGLPAVITIVLAIGIQKMVKKNVIIRKLSAVETLGCTQIICSDKTGTLTQNKMTVMEIYLNGNTYNATHIDKKVVEQNEFDEFTNALLLCNDTKETIENGENKFLGDPTETCLVEFAQKYGKNKEELETLHARIDEIPFDSTRKMMTTINSFEGQYKVYVKGATESILSRCNKIIIDGEIRNITEDDLININTANRDKAKNALRVLSIAYRDTNTLEETHTTHNTEKDLIFVGLVGMIDPPRPEVKDAVKTCFEAGITPIMITGDNRETALAIAKEIGIIQDESEVMEGKELDNISDDDFMKIVQKYKVYARVSPENKVRIVRAWKSLGNVVAMTGDGVNDAPALKSADIGIGMGITGTEVSKNVSSMILTDDNFASIVSAVKEGRRIYSNIKKAIGYLLCSNAGEIVAIFIATLLFNFKILHPIHILWINLVTDTLPALALGQEKAESHVMREKPRDSKKGFFDFSMSSYILTFGVIKGLIVLAVAKYAYMVYDTQDIAITMSFLTLGFLEIFFAITCKSEKSLLKINIFNNIYLIGATILGIGMQALLILIPKVREWFDLAVLNKEQWMIVIFSSVSIIVVSEIIKLLNNIFKGKGKFKKIMPTIIIFFVIISSFTAYIFYMNKIENTCQARGVEKEVVLSMLEEQEDIYLLDVREKWENANIRIKNSINIPKGELTDKVQQVLTDKSKKVVIYCKSGKRSKDSLDILENMGYKRIYSLNGGISNFKYSEYILKGE